MNIRFVVTFLILLTSSCAQGMQPNLYGLEPASKKHQPEFTNARKLLDASIHGRKSRFYKPSYKPTYYMFGENEGVSDLHRAIIAGDVQDCINLVAKDNDFRSPLFNGQTYLHIAAQCGFDSFCEFMLKNGVCVNTPIKGSSITALVLAAEKKKLETCKFLLQNGAHTISLHRDYTWDIFNCFMFAQELESATFIDVCKLLALKQKAHTNADVHEMSGNTLFDIALQKHKHTDVKRVMQLIPAFIALGEGPEAVDHKGKTPVCRLLWQYFDQPSNFTAGFLNCVATYHAALEAQDLPAVKAALLIYTCCKDSILARLPKDVFIFCILRKYLVPFHTKQVQICVDQQLALGHRLLKRSYTPELVEEICSQLPNQKDADAVLALINPDNINQYRPKLIALNRTLMDLPAESNPA